MKRCWHQRTTPLEALVLLGMIAFVTNCRPNDGFSDSQGRYILELLRAGRLPEARRILSATHTHNALVDDLWAKYHLEVVKRTPISADSINAARAIPPQTKEYELARQYIHKFIEFSVRSADGDSTHLASQLVNAEESLWRGDGGRELNVLLALVRVKNCFADDELPCLQSQITILRNFGAISEVDFVVLAVTNRLIERAAAAGNCAPCDDACIERAIESWRRWEEFSGGRAVQLAELKRKQALCGRTDR
jgi:hypothetical protein